MRAQVTDLRETQGKVTFGREGQSCDWNETNGGTSGETKKVLLFDLGVQFLLVLHYLFCVAFFPVLYFIIKWKICNGTENKTVM